MQIRRVMLLSVLSEALDSVEKELLGATDHHAKRVAHLCVRMARRFGMVEEERTALAVSALFHDSALSEHRNGYYSGSIDPAVVRRHCAAGEDNLRFLPGDVSREFVLYHHENADGSGPFGKTADETPLGAQLIHIADMIDRRFPLGALTDTELPGVMEYVEGNRGTLFASAVCDLLRTVLTEECLDDLADWRIAGAAPEVRDDPCEVDLRALSSLFARIIDYKSPFTKDHSVGLAEKAEMMARHYGWDDAAMEQIYFAGALHDIGKLMVDRSVLEKPGKLDHEEYQHIQSHAFETFRLLSKLDGLEDVTRWAAYHHEKLNGKGYPFGLGARELDERCRLMACLDIYQALTEERPYKSGMPHGKAMAILRELVEKGELDGRITEDIDRVFGGGDGGGEADGATLLQCRVCGHICDEESLRGGNICPVCGKRGMLPLLRETVD